MTQTSTEDCPQSLIAPWWVETQDRSFAAGRLVWAFVKHVDQVPQALVATGRGDNPRQHSLADCEIVPVSSDKLFSRSRLPVAALPCFDREIRAVYRAKKRPVLVLTVPGPEIDRKALGFTDKPKAMTARTLMVAPFYGIDEGTGRRAGWPAPFVERVKRCEYPEYVYDNLPLDLVKESILRLDHIQPISTHHVAYEATGWTLSDEALAVMQEWVAWHLLGRTPDPDDELSMLGFLRQALAE